MSWLVGVMLVLVGTLCTTLGMSLQKLAPSIRHTQRWTAFGMLLVGLTQLLDFFALAFTSQSVVGALNACSLGFSLLWAHVFFGERTTRCQLYGLVTIALAVFVILLSADRSTHVYTIHDILELLLQTSFLLYLVGVMAMMLLFYWTRPRMVTVVGSNINQETMSPVWSTAVPAALSGQSFLMSKILSELLATTLNGNNQLNHPFPWMCLVLLLICIYVQQHFHTRMLHKVQAQHIAMYLCFIIVASVVVSFCVFQEYRFVSLESSCLVWVGIALAIQGIFVFQLVETDTSANQTQLRHPIGFHPIDLSDDGVRVVIPPEQPLEPTMSVDNTHYSFSPPGELTMTILEPERICPWSDTVRVTFVQASSLEDIPREQISCAFVLPFSTDGALELGLHSKRGWDILGGHVEEGEAPSLAALRELKEESGRILEESDLVLLGYEKLVETGPRRSEKHPYPVSYFIYYVARNIDTSKSLQPRSDDDEEMTQTRFFAPHELANHKWFAARANAFYAAQQLANSLQ